MPNFGTVRLEHGKILHGKSRSSCPHSYQLSQYFPRSYQLGQYETHLYHHSSQLRQYESINIHHLKNLNKSLKIFQKLKKDINNGGDIEVNNLSSVTK